MAEFKFRLQLLLDRALETQESLQQALALRQKELHAERVALEKASDHVKGIEQKISTSRRTLVAPGRGSHEIEFRRDYLRGLQEDLEAANDAVFAQQTRVRDAERAVASTRDELTESSRQVQVLEKYRERQQARFRRQLEAKEAIEQDEMGSMAFLRRNS